jgi:RNA polymerase-binding transcription factor DksA
MQHPLTPQELRKYEARLQTLFASLSETVAGVEREALEPSGGTRFQEPDESVEETALTTDIESLRAADELGYEVRDALERLAQHKFGACEACGQQISRERLEVLPYARECKVCAHARERRPR